MKLEFPQLNKQNLPEAVKLLYDCFKQNEWINEYYTEEEIKEQIMESINDQEAFRLSTLVVDVDNNNAIIGMHLALPLIHYIRYSENWDFHLHFAEMEDYFEEIISQAGAQRLEKTVWSYWVTNTLTSQRVPMQLTEILAQKIKEEGKYDAVVSFLSHIQSKVFDAYGTQYLQSVNIVDLKSKKAIQEFLSQKPEAIPENEKEKGENQSDCNDFSYQNSCQYYNDDNNNLKSSGSFKNNIFEQVYTRWKNVTEPVSENEYIFPKL